MTRVPVDVPVVEQALAATSRAKASGDEVAALAVAAALTSVCWPYVLRLVEDNCEPGKELHPAARPLYEAFVALSSEFAPNDPTQRYAQWLVGDGPSIADTTSVSVIYVVGWIRAGLQQRGRVNRRISVLCYGFERDVWERDVWERDVWH